MSKRSKEDLAERVKEIEALWGILQDRGVGSLNIYKTQLFGELFALQWAAGLSPRKARELAFDFFEGELKDWHKGV